MYYVKSRSYLEGTMRLNKMTGRVIATMGIAAMMMTQTAGVMAAEQTENKQLKVVYYNQADYPGKKIGCSLPVVTITGTLDSKASFFTLLKNSKPLQTGI